MTRQVVPREDGRVVIYYTFEDEERTTSERETPKPASTAQPSATDSDVLEDGK
jgi:hypothetical protein